MTQRAFLFSLSEFLKVEEKCVWCVVWEWVSDEDNNKKKPEDGARLKSLLPSFHGLSSYISLCSLLPLPVGLMFWLF